MEMKKFTRDELNKMSKDELTEMILSSQGEMEDLRAQYELLKEQFTLSRSRQFGRSSEKDIDEKQLRMSEVFNEAEYESDNNKEAETEEITYKRRKRTKGKLDENLSGLPVRIIEHTISEEELKEAFPDGYERFPDEVYRKLEYHPASFEVLEHHIAVYHGKSGNIIRAEHPKEMLDKSIATPSITAGIINAKYVNAVPLYRIEQEFKRQELNISRQTMANWCIKVSERYLSLLVRKLKEDMLSRNILHADETPVRVTKDGRKPGSKSYMWVYRTGEYDKKPIILYDYKLTRSENNLEEFLNGYSGVLISDGYAAYHKLAKEKMGEITASGCWAHARRGFAEIVKSSSGSDKKKSKYSIADEALERIGSFYGGEDKTLSFEERNEQRTSISEKVDEFFAWAKSIRSETTKGSKLGKSLDYCINQEEYLRAFLKNPDIPMDNNAAERAIRPFCIGKKNWVMIDTVNGAKASADIYSLIETAKANNLKPYEYIKHILNEVPLHMDDTSLDFLEDLLPWSETLPDICKLNTK